MVYKSSAIAAGSASSGGSGGGIQSINADTTPAQLIVQGAGINVSTIAGTTTITNTSAGSAGVSSFNSRTGVIVPQYGDYNFNLISGTATASQGGTGLQTLTAHAVLLGEGVNNVSFATTGAPARILVDQGNADPVFKAISGDVSLVSTGATVVLAVHGVSYPSSPSTNTVPVVTGSNTITYEAVPNAALANSAITVNAGIGLSGGGSVALGSAISLNNAGVTSFTGDGTIINNSGSTGSVTVTLANTPTGSGSVVLASAPTMTNPIVGTQSTSDNSTKAASTAYVTTAITNAIAGVNPAVAVFAATTQASDTSGLTYNNGVSGVGATFTGSNNTPITFDGQTLTSLNQRVLIKNDTQSPSGAFNGVYYLTQIQTGILPPILTRALDYNMPSDINSTGAIPVVNGTLNANTSWLLTSSVTTVGTDPLTYTKFTVNPSTIITTSTIAGGGLTGTYPNPSLANPSASSLGGVNSISAITHNFLTGLATSGVFSQSQPAFTDITGSVTTAQLPTNQTKREVVFSLDGQGAAVSGTGTWYLASTPFVGTITAWNLVADISGSVSIDIWKANAAVPTISNTIVGGNYPALSSAQSAFSGSITSWTSAVSANDVWAFNIRSASTVTKISLSVQITAS